VTELTVWAAPPTDYSIVAVSIVKICTYSREKNVEKIWEIFSIPSLRFFMPIYTYPNDKCCCNAIICGWSGQDWRRDTETVLQILTTMYVASTMKTASSNTVTSINKKMAGTHTYLLIIF